MAPVVGIVTELPAPYRIPLFNELHERLDGGLRVYFMSERAGRDWTVDRAAMRFHWRRLPGIPLQPGGRGQGVFYVNGAAPWWLRRDGVEVVVVGGYNHGEYLSARAWTRARKRPLLLWSESVARGPEATWRLRAKGALVRMADGAIVPGRAAAERVQALAPALPVEVAPNSVDVDFWGAGARPRAPQRPLRVLFAGQLVARKQPLALVEALEAVPDATLDVVGTGPLEAELRCRAGDRVRLHGHLEGEALRERYRAADVFVLPSVDEVWGLVVNEAMAAGCCVVASRAAGATADLVDDGVTGRVVEPDGAGALARVLSELARDPAQVARLSAAGLERARAFTPAATADGFLRAIERVA